MGNWVIPGWPISLGENWAYKNVDVSRSQIINNGKYRGHLLFELDARVAKYRWSQYHTALLYQLENAVNFNFVSLSIVRENLSHKCHMATRASNRFDNKNTLLSFRLTRPISPYVCVGGISDNVNANGGFCGDFAGNITSTGLIFRHPISGYPGPPD